MSKQHVGKTILIVEDDQNMGNFLSQAVAQETSYHAVLVANGLQALQVAATLHPALLITDYWLPGIDGLELLDRIHSQPGLEELPALMISARLPKGEQRDLIRLKKPIELDVFLYLIARLLPSSASEI